MKIKSVLFVAAVCVLAALTSCGGSKKGGLPNFGDDEFAVATIGTSSAALQTTYPATIKGIQDVEVRPKVSGFITKVLYTRDRLFQQVRLCSLLIARPIRLLSVLLLPL